MKPSVNTIINALSGAILLRGSKRRAKTYLKDMNKKMIQYLQKCPADQLKLWTWLFASSDDQDSIQIELKEVRMQFKMTPKVFMRVLGLDEMQGQQFITYQYASKTEVRIKFNKRNDQVVQQQLFSNSSGNGKALVISKGNDTMPSEKDQSFENELSTILDGNDKALIPNEKQIEVIGVRKIEFSIELRNWLIDDYTEFFISIQKSRNFLAGFPNAPVLPPKFDGADIKFFKALTNYFRNLPRPSGGKEPLTDEEVRSCFQKIYSCWEQFDSYVQNGIKPQQIWHNLNSIVSQLVISRKNKNHHRNAEFNKKAERTGSRDFSHILQKRAEGTEPNVRRQTE